MSIIDRIKSILGLDRSDAERTGRVDPTVAVEHDPDAGTESAVKGVDAGESSDDPAATGTEAAASTGSLVDEAAAEDAPTAAEQAEAAGPEPDEMAVDNGDDAAAEDDAPTAAEQAEAAGPEPDEMDADPDEGVDAAESVETAGVGESVETIKGIGPAYGERLTAAGVETVADLAAADPVALAAETDLPESRVTEWVDRANDRS